MTLIDYRLLFSKGIIAILSKKILWRKTYNPVYGFYFTFSLIILKTNEL